LARMGKAVAGRRGRDGWGCRGKSMVTRMTMKRKRRESLTARPTVAVNKKW